VLYLTVQGELHKTSTVRKNSIPSVSFGGDIPFALDVQNIGNTHFFTHASGSLNGLGPKKTGDEVTRLLLPDTARSIGSTIPAPLLPGIYKAAYGYRTDAGQNIRYSKYVLYLPPWAIIIPFFAGWAGVKFWRLQKRKAAKATRS
jgi:hypothetical protein